jgi:hypothetical protein
MRTVDCMYPSKGRSDNRILSLVVDTHAAAFALDKHQEKNRYILVLLG